jgi:uncharacterized repeat protein (TIGR02543 family)
MNNIFDELESKYGQSWEYVSGFDINPQPNVVKDTPVPNINVLGGTNSQYDMPLFEAVPWYVKHGVPVVIGWQGWGGHYETVIGFDDMGTTDVNDDVMILMDSYDSVDHLMDGYVIKPYKKFIDDWTVGGWGEALKRYVFIAAWPTGFFPETFTHTNNGIAPPISNGNSSPTSATPIAGTDQPAYASKVTSQIASLTGAQPISGGKTVTDHLYTPYYKTDPTSMAPGSLTLLDGISHVTDVETIQQSAMNLDGPASLLMAMNYTSPTGMMTDVDLAKMKGPGKELQKSTLADMTAIIDKINAQAVAVQGYPAWDYYTTEDMAAGKKFFGVSGIDEFSVMQTALENGAPLLTLAHEGGDQWQVAIGMDDVRSDDGDEFTQDNVIIYADPRDTVDHNQNGLSLYMYEWLVYDWGNSIGSSDGWQSFIALWPHKPLETSPPPVGSYRVSFDPNGGSAPSFATKNVKQGDKYGALPTVSRKGYEFTGWYTAQTGGVKVTQDSALSANRDHTLYAQWRGKLNELSVTVANKTWTGRQFKSGFALKADGKALSAGKDYTIVSYGKNTNIGKGSVTVKGAGEWTGQKTIIFKINPTKPSIKSVKPGKKKVAVKWKKVSSKQKVSSYQIRYKVKGTSKWKTKTISAKKASLSITKLRKGKAYQFQVRAVKKVIGVKYYSVWSGTKTSKKIK